MQRGGSCGVPGVVATAVASNGSVANINGIQSGRMESGFTQSDVAYWAYTGTGMYEGKPKVADLRLIANLYPETIHLVARKGASIKSVADLKGKRVSLDEPGSGTLIDARTILAAYGLTKDINPEYLKPNQAGDKMKDGALDAFFFVGGYPAGAISELASAGGGIDLVPLDRARSRQAAAASTLLRPRHHPRQHVQGHRRVKTIAVGAQWVTSDKADALTSTRSPRRCGTTPREPLDAGHAKGKVITKENAVGRGHSVPSGRREVLQGSRAAEVTAAAAAMEAGRRHPPCFDLRSDGSR